MLLQECDTPAGLAARHGHWRAVQLMVGSDASLPNVSSQVKKKEGGGVVEARKELRRAWREVRSLCCACQEARARLRQRWAATWSAPHSCASPPPAVTRAPLIRTWCSTCRWRRCGAAPTCERRPAVAGAACAERAACAARAAQREPLSSCWQPVCCATWRMCIAASAASTPSLFGSSQVPGAAGAGAAARAGGHARAVGACQTHAIAPRSWANHTHSRAADGTDGWRKHARASSPALQTGVFVSSPHAPLCSLVYAWYMPGYPQERWVVATGPNSVTIAHVTEARH